MSAKIYQSRKGCDRKDSCAYLHREKQSTINNDDIESAHKGKIKDLDDSIAQMTDVINKKMYEYKNSQKELKKLKHAIEKKNIEIHEKDKIIERLEDEVNYSTEESEGEDDQIDNNKSNCEGFV